MSAGQLRERVTFSSPALQQDEYGNETRGWTDELTVWARIMPLRGGEDVMAARLSGRQPIVIQVRSSGDSRRVTTDWRATNARSGEVYNIRSVANMDEKNAYLDILAESGVA